MKKWNNCHTSLKEQEHELLRIWMGREKQKWMCISHARDTLDPRPLRLFRKNREHRQCVIGACPWKCISWSIKEGQGLPLYRTQKNTVNSILIWVNTQGNPTLVGRKWYPFEQDLSQWWLLYSMLSGLSEWKPSTFSKALVRVTIEKWIASNLEGKCWAKQPEIPC